MTRQLDCHAWTDQRKPRRGQIRWNSGPSRSNSTQAKHTLRPKFARLGHMSCHTILADVGRSTTIIPGVGQHRVDFGQSSANFGWDSTKRCRTMASGPNLANRCEEIRLLCDSSGPHVLATPLAPSRHWPPEASMWREFRSGLASLRDLDWAEVLTPLGPTSAQIRA